MKRLTQNLLYVGLIVAMCASAVFLSSCKSDTGTSPVVPSGSLTLKLDPSIGGGGDIKAASLVKGVMLTASGATIKTGTVTSGNLVFDLSGVNNGDYFIVVNDSVRDKVPTRITDASKNYIQLVGQKLRISFITMGADTLFRVKTYTQGQGEHPVRKYSDGSNLSNYSWVILAYKVSPVLFEIRTVEDNRLLNSISSANQGPHNFTAWIVGGSNHGKGPGGNLSATTTQCGSCHTNFDTKPATWTQVTATNGFCYKCHYGIGGDPDGFLDPTK